MSQSALDKVLAVSGRVRMQRWTRVVPQIKSLQASYADLNDVQLRKEGLALQYRAKCGETLEHLLPEAFALV